MDKKSEFTDTILAMMNISQPAGAGSDTLKSASSSSSGIPPHKLNQGYAFDRPGRRE